MVENSRTDAAPDALSRPRWTLRILGGFRLIDPTGGEAHGLGKLDRALLGYLVLSRQPRYTRSRLAGLLWPNRSEALHSLSVSLNTLRKALGDKDGAILALKSDPLICRFEALSVDALAFETLASRNTPEALEQAEALYEGDLLDGLDIRSTEFENWLAAERARLRALAVDCLCRVMRHREQSGLPQQAIDTAQRILKLDDLCEDAHRSLIRLKLKAGQRLAALTHAQYCEDLFRRERIEPEPETTRLIAESRQRGSAGDERSRRDAVEPLAPTEGTSAPSPEGTGRPGDGSLRPSAPWRRLWPAIAGPLFGLPLLAALATSLIYQKNPELLPAWIADIVIPIQRIDPRPPRPSVAVMPFAALGDDAMAAQLADGISEGITSALSIASDIRVVSSYSVRATSIKPISLTTLARELDVRYLLRGTVQKWDDRINVEVGLIDTDEGERQICCEPHDRTLGNFIDLQKDITLEVITSLQVTLTKGETERINLVHGTRNLDAWLTAAQGEIALRKLTREDNIRARSLYLEAQRLDPKYAGPWDGIAWTHLVDARLGWSPSPKDSIAQAATLAQQALTLDPHRSRTIALLGTIALLTCSLDQAVDSGEAAVSLEPNDADSAALLAYTLTYTGEPNRAINLVQEKAMKLSPYYPDWYGWLLGRAKRLADNHDEAETWLTAGGTSHPQSLLALTELTATYVALGRLQKARTTAKDILRLDPDFSVRRWMTTPCYSDPTIAERDVQALVKAGLPE
jgi:TolB-like protein/DNA-binding SARP family transcriptional activator